MLLHSVTMTSRRAEASPSRAVLRRRAARRVADAAWRPSSATQQPFPTTQTAATSCHALIPRSPAVDVRLRVRLFGALGRVRDVSGFPSEPFVQTQGAWRSASARHAAGSAERPPPARRRLHVPKPVICGLPRLSTARRRARALAAESALSVERLRSYDHGTARARLPGSARAVRAPVRGAHASRAALRRGCAAGRRKLSRSPQLTLFG